LGLCRDGFELTADGDFTGQRQGDRDYRLAGTHAQRVHRTPRVGAHRIEANAQAIGHGRGLTDAELEGLARGNAIGLRRTAAAGAGGKNGDNEQRAHA